MMKENKIEQETLVKIQEQLKDFSGSKKLLNKLNDVSWVAKMMGCDDSIVTTTFNDASHEFSELDNESAQALVLAYATGMDKCKSRIFKKKNTDDFNKIRWFIKGVTNCVCMSFNQDKDKVDDTDMVRTAWMIHLIYTNALSSSQDSPKADTFTAQPKPDKPAPKDNAANINKTLFTKWAESFKTKNGPEEIARCTTEISMYIYENMSDTNMLGEVCAFGFGSDIKSIVNKIAVALSGTSVAVEQILTNVKGFAMQFCELAKLVGCPDWMKVDGFSKPDETVDSDKYSYEPLKDVLKSYLDKIYGGDVMAYLAG